MIQIMYDSYHGSTHWNRVTQICVVKITIIGSYNSLSAHLHQAIILTKADLLLSEPLGTNFYEVWMKISFKKTHVKMLSAKRQPFCLSPNVFTTPSKILLPNWQPYHWFHVAFPLMEIAIATHQALRSRATCDWKSCCPYVISCCPGQSGVVEACILDLKTHIKHWRHISNMQISL